MVGAIWWLFGGLVGVSNTLTVDGNRAGKRERRKIEKSTKDQSSHKDAAFPANSLPVQTPYNLPTMPAVEKTPSTLYDKIYADHVVDGHTIYIDRHLVHEVTSPQAFEGLRNASRTVRRPDCTLATVDHVRTRVKN